MIITDSQYSGMGFSLPGSKYLKQAGSAVARGAVSAAKTAGAGAVRGAAGAIGRKLTGGGKRGPSKAEVAAEAAAVREAAKPKLPWGKIAIGGGIALALAMLLRGRRRAVA